MLKPHCKYKTREFCHSNVLLLRLHGQDKMNRLVWHIKRLLDGHCYCLELILRSMFLRSSVLLYSSAFCSWVRTRKQVEWSWFCLCDHCFSRMFKKVKESHLDQKMLQKNTTTISLSLSLSHTHTHTHTYMWKSHDRLKVEWAEGLKNLCVWMAHHLMSYWRLLL